MTNLVNQYKPSYGWRAAEGWFDITLPGDYVTGDPLAVKVDCQVSGVAEHARLYCVGMTVDGGALTNATQGTPLSGTIATLDVGAEILVFANSDPTAGRATVPNARAVVSMTVPGHNRNTDGWDPDYTSDTAIADTGSGGMTLEDAATIIGGNPFGWPAGAGAFHFSTSGYAVSSFRLYDMTIGSILTDNGITPNTETLAAAQTVSIGLFYFAHTGGAGPGQVVIYGIEVDCGATTVTVDLTHVKRQNKDSTPIGLPADVVSGFTDSYLSVVPFPWGLSDVDASASFYQAQIIE